VRKIFFTDEWRHTRFPEFISTSDSDMFIAGPSARQDYVALDPGTARYAFAGSYALKGREVANLSLPIGPHSHRQIGFIFQSFNLIGDLTVYENVELPLTYRGLNAAERKTAVIDALERVGMGTAPNTCLSALRGHSNASPLPALAGKPAILLATNQPEPRLTER